MHPVFTGEATDLQEMHRSLIAGGSQVGNQRRECLSHVVATTACASESLVEARWPVESRPSVYA